MIYSALILGLLGSWHCIGMCGPIAMMVPGAKGKNRIFSVLLYHSGKILAYVSIGSLIGVFTIMITSLRVQSIITIGAGVLMALLAFLPALLNYIEKKGLSFFNPVIRVKNQLSKALKKEKITYGFYIGFLNGFIPCGMVYVAALGALAQPTAVEGALFMLFFGIGTMPFLSAIIFASSWFKNRFKRLAIPLRTVAFCSVGLFMIWKGINNYNQEIGPPKLGENFEVCE